METGSDLDMVNNAPPSPLTLTTQSGGIPAATLDGGDSVIDSQQHHMQLQQTHTAGGGTLLHGGGMHHQAQALPPPSVEDSPHLQFGVPNISSSRGMPGCVPKNYIEKGYKSYVQAFLEKMEKDAPIIIRLVSLPYKCDTEQILEFFGSSAKVMDGKDGVLIVERPDGATSGDALVLFAEEAEAIKAESKYFNKIGHRCIEVHRITKNLAQCILSWSVGEERQVKVSGTTKNCLHLRNVHFDADFENILAFLGEYSYKISHHDIHFVINNSNGMRTGVWFIHMNSESSARLASKEKNNTPLLIGRSTRFIKVRYCSGDEMADALTRDQRFARAPIRSQPPTNRLQNLTYPSLPTHPMFHTPQPQAAPNVAQYTGYPHQHVPQPYVPTISFNPYHGWFVW